MKDITRYYSDMISKYTPPIRTSASYRQSTSSSRVTPGTRRSTASTAAASACAPRLSPILSAVSTE